MPPTKTGDALFGYLEHCQHEVPWGAFLDAGTGCSSLSWVSGLATQRWTAVTGEPGRAESLRQQFRARMRPQDQIAVGNWANPSFLRHERFDVVLADYLLGAVERHSPYFQEGILRRLKPLVGHRLYVVGLEPYPAPTRPAEQIVADIAHLRDACHLLAGERYHREFPLEWTQRRLAEAGFEVISCRTFPILYGERFITAELGVCEQTLRRIPHSRLVSALRERMETVRKKALQLNKELGGLACSFDYVIAARPER